MINLLKQHSKEIEQWASTFVSEDTDIVVPRSIIKNIKTPRFLRKDLNIPSFFLSESIPHITYIILEPKCHVDEHDHRMASFVFQDQEDNNNYLIPWDGLIYKTTHFVLETNPEAYFVFGDKRHTWEKNKFEVLDVLFTSHYAENAGSTPIRFLYFDYYEN